MDLQEIAHVLTDYIKVLSELIEETSMTIFERDICQLAIDINSDLENGCELETEPFFKLIYLTEQLPEERNIRYLIEGTQAYSLLITDRHIHILRPR